METDKDKKNYQLTCLFRPALTETELKSTIQEIKNRIEKKEGSVVEQRPLKTNLARQSLSYPIKKQEEAFYWHLDFSLPSQALNDLYNDFNSDKNILRYLVTTKKETKPKPEKESPDKTFDLKIIDKIEPLAAHPSFEQPKQKEQTEPRADKIEEEELDKKLNEILNQ